MEAFSARQLLQELGEKYSLRFLERSKHFLGIHRGVCVDASEFRGSIHLYVFSLDADISSQVFEKFNGFTHLHDSGVPNSWVKGNVITETELDKHGCVLELSPDRLKSISDDQFASILDSLANDFQTFGATESVGLCNQCGSNEADSLLYLGDGYQVSCGDCLQELTDNSPDGYLKNAEPVNWKAAIATLLIETVLLALTWGFLQQPFLSITHVWVLFLVPLLSAIWMASSVGAAAVGASFILRIMTVLAIVAATLAGNVWGFKSVVEKAQEVTLTWSDAVNFYFTHQLQLNGDVEALYIFGGVVGAWFGADILKAAGIVKIE